MTDRWIRNAVGGRLVDPDERRSFPAVDPVDGRTFARVHEADADLVDRAVSAARAALTGPWSRWSAAARADLLRRVADRIEQRAEEFVAAEVADTGKPVAEARRLDVARAVANFRTFAGIATHAEQPSFLTELPEGRQALNYAVRSPLGVVAVIVPWNLPLLLLTWKVAPALGCGNAVVVKPSEETPSTATLLAEVLAECGLPAGAYNVVHGFGTGSAGEFLVRHRGVDGVTFTGSSATGSAIMRTVAGQVRPVSFELGGKNAAVVFDDADLDLTVAGLTRSIFANTGQVCLCTERVYLHRPIFDEVAQRLVAAARGLRPGRPQHPATTTGPLISAGHRDKVLSYYRAAAEAGATVLTGGGVPTIAGAAAADGSPDSDGRTGGVDGDAGLDGGWWVEPTLWSGLTNADRPVREEIFGPAAALIPFDTEDEAVALANDTEYGLASSVWTTNLGRGHRVAQRMRVGVSWVNTWFLRDLRSPFGGRGLSGIGREGGDFSVDFYTELTNVCVQI
ncbi:aldehyde dehydrogenase family protein [Micromonospora sp. LOL_021]|uniref:aldehyde dehydrogenase family protein n=1 Tax=Micromonospora sp. LOL_021 TaxID=3345417 RepID=UPI003A896CDE